MDLSLTPENWLVYKFSNKSVKILLLGAICPKFKFWIKNLIMSMSVKDSTASKYLECKFPSKFNVVLSLKKFS